MIRYYPSNQGGSAYPALVAPGAFGGSASMGPSQQMEFFPNDFITVAASGGVPPYTYTMRKSSDRQTAGGASLILTCADISEPTGTPIGVDIVVTDSVDQQAYTEITITLDDNSGFCNT